MERLDAFLNVCTKINLLTRPKAEYSQQAWRRLIELRPANLYRIPILRPAFLAVSQVYKECFKSLVD